MNIIRGITTILLLLTVIIQFITTIFIAYTNHKERKRIYESDKELLNNIIEDMKKQPAVFIENEKESNYESKH